MTTEDTAIRYDVRREDESWDPSWTPSLTLGEDGETTSWEDLPESEFLAFRFRVNAVLTVAGQDFSTTYIPVLDFALAWSWVPQSLTGEPRAETAMTAEGLVYRFVRQQDQVHVSSNLHPGTAAVPLGAFTELVDDMVTRAFGLLYGAHPQLRGNRYLLDVGRRIGRG
ncbi:hypothetical protein [Glycomyces sp. NPDC047010]|uniref:hypothetical protein n=1 Tax=Glycomyces sp. NPDC047010 TaxID=3155023 RepID=UPI0033C79181